ASISSSRRLADGEIHLRHVRGAISGVASRTGKMSNLRGPASICGLRRPNVDYLEEMRAKHHNRIQQEEPALYSIHTEPAFAIGQRAFLLRTPAGNLLWDCVTLLDEATVSQVRDLGGIAAIAISHPHYYASMIDWSEAFGDAPIYIHQAD